MRVLPVRRLPDPVLKRPTRPVLRVTAAVDRLTRQMVATMRAHPRCVGLAAPQVGSSLRIAVMDASVHPKGRGSHGLLVLINPRILDAETGSIQREGCLSVPDLTGNVRRAARVRLEAMDQAGVVQVRWLEGFEAIVAQHEVDHLDGLLFLDRVENLATDVFTRKTYG